MEIGQKIYLLENRIEVFGNDDRKFRLRIPKKTVCTIEGFTEAGFIVVKTLLPFYKTKRLAFKVKPEEIKFLNI